MNDEALSIALALCRRWEGFYAAPYACPAGVPTIGYGTTVYPNGRAVTLADPPITRDQAEALLAGELRKLAPRVLDLVPTIDTPGRLAALVDFSYNAGLGALRSSTARHRALDGRWDLAGEALQRWIYGGGRVLRGLVLRRQAEAALL